MRYFILIFLGIALVGFGASCTSKKKVPEGTILQEITLNVEGMTCGGCEYKVKRALLKLEGVTQAKADHKKGEASVSFIQGKVTENQLVEAVNSSGYKATHQK